jgi:uncharacterized protein (TIGR03083 family)
MTTEKSAVLRSLDAAWMDLTSLVNSIPETELEQDGVIEEWSVKDLFGHMAFWANRAANTLNLVAAGRGDEVGGPETEEELNEWNAREAKMREGKSLAQLREEWERAHADARAALEVFPEEKLDEPFRGNTVVFSYGADTFAHYHEHASQIRAWLRQMETTEA